MAFTPPIIMSGGVQGQEIMPQELSKPLSLAMLRYQSLLLYVLT